MSIEVSILNELITIFEQKSPKHLRAELEDMDFKDVAYAQIMFERIAKEIKDFEMGQQW